MNKRPNADATATFLRCEELRQRAGLSIDELVQLSGNRPARSSVQRLERGLAIRAHNTFRVATALKKKLTEIGAELFDVDKEVVRHGSTAKPTE